MAPFRPAVGLRQGPPAPETSSCSLSPVPWPDPAVLCPLLHRKEETVTVYPADVVLFEGILAFYSQKVRDLFRMKLFVDTDADTRLSRRGMFESPVALSVARGRPLPALSLEPVLSLRHMAEPSLMPLLPKCLVTFEKRLVS